MYILLSGGHPFDYNNIATINAMSIKGRYNFDGEEWESISDEAKNLIRNLLNVDPNNRFSAKDALNSSWIQSDDNIEYEELQSTIENLKQFNARRRLKKGILAVIATNRFSSPTKRRPSSVNNPSQKTCCSLTSDEPITINVSTTKTEP